MEEASALISNTAPYRRPTTMEFGQAGETSSDPAGSDPKHPDKRTGMRKFGFLIAIMGMVLAIINYTALGLHKGAPEIINFCAGGTSVLALLLGIAAMFMKNSSAFDIAVLVAGVAGLLGGIAALIMHFNIERLSQIGDASNIKSAAPSGDTTSSGIIVTSS